MYLMEVFHHGAAFTVGFLPIITAPVTDYATVRKALVNLQSVRKQLSQTMVPVFSDEGVFHTGADILMSEPDAWRVSLVEGPTTYGPSVVVAWTMP